MTWMFRLSATFKEKINFQRLQHALNSIIKRFPYFRVNRKSGLFWYFWDINLGNPKVIGDSKYPCGKMPIHKKGIFPFRVRIYQNRIAVEFHHSITDGTGGMNFIRALVAEYISSGGIHVHNWLDIPHTKTKADPEEFEDASKKYFVPSVPKPEDQARAFQLPNKLAPKGIMYVTTAIISTSDILKLSRSYNVSLTEFIAAVLIDVFQEIIFSYPSDKIKKYLKPVRIVIPVNARKYFPSKTMRNFFYTVTPGIDPRLGKYSLNEIIKIVYHYMRAEINDKNLGKQMKRNVHYELHPLIRIIPLFLKKLLLQIIYPFLGENKTTCALSNIGQVIMPEELNQHIERFEFMASPTRINKITCAVVSYGDNLYMTFTRIFNNPIIEKIFLSRLVKMGIKVKIETNY